MSDADAYLPLSPVQVERELRRLSREGDERMAELADIAHRAAAAEAAWKAGRARAVLASDATSADRREAEALVACRAQHEAHLVAQAELMAATEATRWLRSRIDAVRSVGASVRQAYDLA